MRTDWRSLNENERGAFTALTAFLSGRLASAETINWALQVRRDETVKRIAVMQLVDSPEGRKLREPWRTAWRLIEEYWDSPVLGHLADARPYDIRERLVRGDRSSSLVAATADCVAPQLRLSTLSQRHVLDRKPPKRPRTVTQVLSAGLTSGNVVDPNVIGLHQVNDDAFLAALANALESALTRGLDTARRLGWDGEGKLYRLGQLHRVVFVPKAERRAGEHEPDEFHRGIAPCVKLLHFVVDRLATRRAVAARAITARWKVTPSPIYLRLWAALARYPWIAAADDVGQPLLRLDDRRFWDLQNFPEIAELRAVRFREFDAATQTALVARLRRGPPRNQWSRDANNAHVARARLSWVLRELRRLEIAGGALSARDKVWIEANIPAFPELIQMDRLDQGFIATPEATIVLPNPDVRYDSLIGPARLSALEMSLGSTRRGWDDDPSSRASDWMRQSGNAAKLIADLEAGSDAGAAFPKVWERFGWAHLPANEKDGAKPAAKLAVDATRVLALLKNLPMATAKPAIEGISNWLSNWRSFIVNLPDGLPVWQNLWPVAVEATNAAQPADTAIDLNLVARPSDDHEPMDLDTLNTPAGKLVDVFLAALPTIKGDTNPFALSGAALTMRDTVIASSGRSGLIVRHRLIEALPYFLRMDADWARQHLIAALLNDDADALSLWRALARRTHFVDVLKIIGPAMVMRTSDVRLGRETRHSLVFSLIVESLHALNEGRAPAVSYADIQQMIRPLDDELRAHAAGAVQQFVRDMSAPRDGETPAPTAEELFERAAAPFLHDVWPQERSLATPGVSKAFADLPATARGAFASAVDSIQRFLVPFDSWSLLDYGVFDDEDGDPQLSSIDDAVKAAGLLRLLDSTIGTAPSAVIPHGLAEALARIEAVAPSLSRDPMFRRLAAAARR